MRTAHEAAKSDLGEIIVPRELVEHLEHHPDQSPSLAARRTIALLIMASAGDAWAQMTHRITKAELSGGHKGDERLPALLSEIKGIVYIVPALSTRNRPARNYVSLFERLKEEIDDRGDAWVEWRWSAEIRKVFAESEVFARLGRERLLALESKYSVTLYLIGCLLICRREPRWRARVDELRRVLGVHDDSYSTWTKLDRLVLLPARQELAAIADITMSYQPTPRRGRRVTHVEIYFTGVEHAVRQADGAAPAKRAERRKYLKNQRLTEAARQAQQVARLKEALETAAADELRQELNDALPF